MAVFRKMGVAKWMDGLCQGKSHLEIRMMTGGTPMTQETSVHTHIYIYVSLGFLKNERVQYLKFEDEYHSSLRITGDS